MRFSTWLQNQTDRDDPIGDLAGDVRRDPPAGSWGVRELRRHMRNRGACLEAMEAVTEAASEWRKCCDLSTGGARMASWI